MAPVRRASTTMRRISAISASMAWRRLASSPSTYVRTEECPTKEATLGTRPRRSREARYSGYVSKSQLIPARSASSDMPSTWVRLRTIRPRWAG
jgi:hypothetical protein